MSVRALLVAALVAGLAAGAAPAQASVRDLTLRLADLPPGYTVGDDGGCGLELDDEGAPPVLVRLERERRQVNCSIDFERLWVAPGGPRGPAVVESSAFRFGDPAGAEAGLRAGRELIAYLNAFPLESVERRPAPATVGDSTAVYETDTAIVLGRRPRPAVAVLWRSGRLLSLVVFGGASGSGAVERALALARVQQARIESPTPLPAGANDDREVPLDDPGVDIPIHWLGARLDPSGPLPPLVLENAYGRLGRGESPGWRAEVGYRTAGDRGAGVQIGLWRPRAFDRFARTRTGRLVWTGGCARLIMLGVPGGRARIYAGYARTPRRCGQRPPDRYVAHVFLGEVVATVNVPVCPRCLDRGPRGDPYDTRAGLTAVVRALVLRG